MSAIPLSAYTPQKTSNYLTYAMEETDKAILSHEDVYALKGGDQIFLAKAGVGLFSAAVFLKCSGRLCELQRFNIQGSTFFWANVFGISSMSLFQKGYINYTGQSERYRLHQLALFNRYINNMSYIMSNKKKPKIH